MTVLGLKLNTAIGTFGKIAKGTALIFFFSLTTLSCQSKKPIFLNESAIQLSLPIVHIDSSLFRNSALVKVDLAYDNAILRYTTDGSNVTENASSYGAPLKITTTTHLKVRAFHKDFKPSEELAMVIRKMSKDISNAAININPGPNENYKGSGENTLIDGLKGTVNFRNGAKWLGFQENEIVVDLKFSEPILVEKLIMSVLQDQGSWIFLPASISVKSKKGNIGAIELNSGDEAKSKTMDFIEVPVQKEKYSELTITISSLKEIPGWHPGKGTLPWVFVDEIIVE
ncbi:hypothetical protein DKG77_01220 [Flagellimonas aquimarina]|uniref:GH29D-like beta-sandwich domain-containing protein n=1 Tax=Flagellimonas aquimarina TaxID=2201895 RepID=A0A316KYZ1_9FLAO|nr:chitobiase/beta-hexosaminidase C-terminal domain-containing protein [Allomuricauda koreensis]PWL39487.1 hypothetical protein DKG77_01220 [Allomuricauda koreensis]